MEGMLFHKNVIMHPNVIFIRHNNKKKSRKALFLIHIRDIPDESPDSVFFVYLVQILDVFQNQGNHLFFNNG